MDGQDGEDSLPGLDWPSPQSQTSLPDLYSGTPLQAFDSVRVLVLKIELLVDVGDFCLLI